MATATSDIVTPYRQSKSLSTRTEEARVMLLNDPTRVPIIIERGANEKFLPALKKAKFLIPRNSSLNVVHHTIRARLQLHQDQSFFLLINGVHMPTMSSSVEEIYEQHKSNDGFLYMTYASQEVYG